MLPLRLCSSWRGESGKSYHECGGGLHRLVISATQGANNDSKHPTVKAGSAVTTPHTTGIRLERRLVASMATEVVDEAFSDLKRV